ncbi:MAG: DUF3320 domain-containing protein [Janthinobacterium lividum]
MTIENTEVVPLTMTSALPQVNLAVEMDKTIGYAAIQNHIPVIRSLTVTNTGAATLFAIEAMIRCTPAFALGTRLHFDQLAPGESRRISPVDLHPDHDYLSQLDETTLASVNVQLSAQEQTISETRHEIEVLAYDQWAGTRALPELLAAFCMPNAPVIDHLLSSASTLLRQADGGGAMNGYQDKSRDAVWRQVSALYSTLLAKELHYSNPPASFGNGGQKIRTPERILDGKVATCLDLAMLFASCLEQAGLHPVILIKEAHAWVGVWLVETCFATALIDDVQAIRKRVKSGEFLVFETTGVAGGQKPSLQWACSTGAQYLDDGEDFQYAIDIRRARELQIRPLPSRSSAGNPPATSPENAPSSAAPGIEPAPALPVLDQVSLPLKEGDIVDTPEGRLARWKSRLLDLTLRNRLLNFKPAKTNVKLICPDPAALEDLLSDGREFRIRACPPLMAGTAGANAHDARDAATFSGRSGSSVLDVLAADALSRREIIVDVAEDVLEARLLEIYRAAGTGMEEGGANTLFMVFGLLQWQEEKHAELHHLAPILLIPVSLTRESVRSGFRLLRHDDEAIINPTLIQKLAQDFSLKIPTGDLLPVDDKGIDVERVLQNFRLAVSELQGWEVRDQVHLGIFSFTKYLMWKDLQSRQAQLSVNPIVAHLINNPGQSLPSEEIGFEPATLDASHKPQDLFAPLLSDSSQLRAICAASAGQNLVVEGPPGTGKSQTITNLITHLLATGKTVLFVSEKMAALDVVHRRLKSIGLGPFCLELHSSKARKSEVLKQLGMALDAAGARTVADWEREAERLSSLRLDLNGLAKALHHRHPNGLSIFDAIGMCIKHGERRAAKMDWADAGIHGRAELEALREQTRQMAALASQLSAINHHPLALIGKTDWTPSWQQTFQDTAGALDQACETLQQAVGQASDHLGLAGNGLSLAGLNAIDALADLLLRAPDIPLGIAGAAHDESARNKLRFLRQHGLARQKAWDALGNRYAEELASVPAAELSMAWRAATLTWWQKNWFARRAVTARLRLYRLDRTRPPETELPALLAALGQVNAADSAMALVGADAALLLNEHYVAHRTDWAVADNAAEWAEAFSRTVSQLVGADLELAQRLRARLQSLVTQHRDMLRPGNAIGASLLAYRDAYRACRAHLLVMADVAHCTAGLGQLPQADGALARLRALLQSWQQAQRQLQPWCLWQRARLRACASGLQGLVDALESDQVALEEIADFFEFSYQSWWVKKIIDREPVLCTFSSADHGRKIAEFRAADARFQTLTQQYVVARLSGEVPANSGITPGAESEMGKLRRELQRQRGNMPIRQLVQSLPTLMPKLKPCLLMSPLSVAQYLDAGHAQFDVVIFDEASQIPVWDAVGAIARGQQLVCVGDPKQLPPTNFFGRTDDPEEMGSDEEIQDLESILDECLSIGMPKLGLNWHYRSQHESLITFSNVTYYDNRLVTFPSPFTEDRGVRFEPVAGVYDRGGSRTNRAEAEAIVKAIETHYLDAATRDQTLGVVTFNQAQQSLIEQLLDQRRRASAPLDQAISRIVAEPLFIKNLENVQGDERDIIYFSITYGPDQAGKVSLNFGPLNLEGGHRRLNVAVSRARQGVVVFSTLMPDQIDLSKIRAAGVRDLKHYLEFAMRGPRALVEQVTPTGMEPESPFEEQVIKALREHGWVAHPQVGVSGYRIDIGVVDPRAPGRYLLGVECDGATYHSGATARDRDRLRQHVLEGLGWNLFRIWSTDWWLNPQEPMKKLIARLDALLAQEDAAKVADTDTDAGAVVAESAIEPIEPAPEELIAENQEPDQVGLVSAKVSDDLPQLSITRLSPGDPEKFHDKASEPLLLSQLLEVIETEGPVADDILYRRVARAWGMAKTGSRIERLLSNLIGEAARHTESGTRFYWPASIDPQSWEGFRTPGQDPESKRTLDEICFEEIGNLALFIVSRHGSTTITGLARSICRLMKISRTTASAEDRVGQAIRVGRVAGCLRVEGESVSLVR